METIIARKRWRWIGHVLRKGVNSITKVAIHLDPRGKRKHDRRETTWRRTVEAEMKKMNHSWGTIQRLASDRQGWRSFTATLYARWRYWQTRKGPSHYSPRRLHHFGEDQEK